MNFKFYSSTILFLVVFLSCNRIESTNSVSGLNDSLSGLYDNLKNAETGLDIWQLDYYPDSIFINRSIFDNSEWSSGYAYCIQFMKDSCQFIGWHESAWVKLIKMNDKEYRTLDPQYYWELKFISADSMLMRQIVVGKQKTDIREFYPYHKVDKILTMDSIDRKIAKEIFSGTYNVLYHDTLDCKNTIVLDHEFGVKGISDIESYYFETDIDCDFPIFNVFGFNRKGEHGNTGFSFQFSGDTLFIKDYEVIRVDGDFDHVEISKTRIKLVKME